MTTPAVSGATTPVHPTAHAVADQVLATLNAQVASRFAALERELAEYRRSAHSTSKAPAPAKPDKYSGRPGKAEQWAFEMELYFDATGILDPKRVPFAAAMLTDHAGIWWRSVNLGNDEPITTWEDFKRQLLLNFQHVDSEKTARRRLRYLRQKTSVAAYYSEFTRATLEIPAITEDEKMDRFFAGLKPPLQREITLREPADYATLVRMAHKLDEVLYTASRDSSSSWRRSDGPGPRPMELGAIDEPSTSRAAELNAMQRSAYNRSRFSPSLPSQPRSTGPRPKLTDAERDRLRKEGSCFYCKEQGHLALYCPKKPGNEKKAGKAPAR